MKAINNTRLLTLSILTGIVTTILASIIYYITFYDPNINSGIFINENTFLDLTIITGSICGAISLSCYINKYKIRMFVLVVIGIINPAILLLTNKRNSFADVFFYVTLFICLVAIVGFYIALFINPVKVIVRWFRSKKMISIDPTNTTNNQVLLFDLIIAILGIFFALLFLYYTWLFISLLNADISVPL
jgi:hypothetical protein